MGSLRMPDILRKELSSETYGVLLTGSPAENASRVKEIIEGSKPPKVVVVGDFTLKAILGAGISPDLGVFDRKTKRAPYDFPGIRAENVRNPPGEITDEAASSVRKALSARRRGRVMLAVEGEEDLLSLTAILNAPEGSLVIYGLPDRGMMVVTVEPSTKSRVASMMKGFKRVK